MIRVAILGSENSHAVHFASAIAGRDGSRMFPDMELIGVYGDKNAEDAQKGNEQIAEKSICPCFADSYLDFLGKADAVMVTARHGKRHLEYAREYLKQGIPVWVDKPICTEPEEALELVSLARQYDAPICGGSSLVHTEGVLRLSEYVKEQKREICGGHVTAPINMVNDYGNFWFYSQHLVQMITKIFGYDMKSVSARADKDSVCAEYFYEGFSVTAFFGAGYSAAVYKDNYSVECEKITLGGGYFVPELQEFYHMVKTGKSGVSFQELTAPVFIIDATIRAFEKGRETAIKIPEL